MLHTGLTVHIYLNSVPRIAALITVRANMGPRAYVGFYEAQAVCKDYALFFSTGEESSQPNQHANKIIISIFLTIKTKIQA